MDWDRLITIEQMEEATNTAGENGSKEKDSKDGKKKKFWK